MQLGSPENKKAKSRGSTSVIFGHFFFLRGSSSPFLGFGPYFVLRGCHVVRHPNKKVGKKVYKQKRRPIFIDRTRLNFNYTDCSQNNTKWLLFFVELWIWLFWCYLLTKYKMMESCFLLMVRRLDFSYKNLLSSDCRHFPYPPFFSPNNHKQQPT